MKPTVGRVVWYYVRGKEQVDAEEQPFVAFIAKVNSDTNVNLGFFDSDGHSNAATSITLLADGEEPSASSYCTWPTKVAEEKAPVTSAPPEERSTDSATSVYEALKQPDAPAPLEPEPEPPSYRGRISHKNK